MTKSSDFVKLNGGDIDYSFVIKMLKQNNGINFKIK